MARAGYLPGLPWQSDVGLQ